MKVILHNDVAKLGKKFDIVEVADGYARNYLIPKKLAELATPGKIKSIENQRQEREAAEAEQREAVRAQLEPLLESGTELAAPANEQGHLFAGLHVEDIARHLSEQAAVEVPEHWIVMDDAIKETGEHTVSVRVGDETLDVPVTVTPQQQ